jgi:hypothetical protein
MFRLFGGARDVSLLQSAQIASGAHPAFTATGIRTILYKGAQSGCTVQLTTPHIAPRLRTSGTVSLLSLYMGIAVLPCLLVIRRSAIWVTESAVNKP